jgi:hypothetical protein
MPQGVLVDWDTYGLDHGRVDSTFFWCYRHNVIPGGGGDDDGGSTADPESSTLLLLGSGLLGLMGLGRSSESERTNSQIAFKASERKMDYGISISLIIVAYILGWFWVNEVRDYYQRRRMRL